MQELGICGYYAKNMKTESTPVRKITYQKGMVRLNYDIGALLQTSRYIMNPDTLAGMEGRLEHTRNERICDIKALNNPDILVSTVENILRNTEGMIKEGEAIHFEAVENVNVWQGQRTVKRKSDKGGTEETEVSISQKPSYSKDTAYVAYRGTGIIAHPEVLSDIWNTTCSVLGHIVAPQQFQIQSMYDETSALTLNSPKVVTEALGLLRFMRDKKSASLTGASIQDRIDTKEAQDMWAFTRFWMFRELWYKCMTTKSEIAERILMTKLFLDSVCVLDALADEEYHIQIDSTDVRYTGRHANVLDQLLKAAKTVQPIWLATFGRASFLDRMIVKSNFGKWLYAATPVYSRIQYGTTENFANLEGFDGLSRLGFPIRGVELGSFIANTMIPTGIDFTHGDPGYYRSTRSPSDLVLRMSFPSPLMFNAPERAKDLFFDLERVFDERQTSRAYATQILQTPEYGEIHTLTATDLQNGGSIDGRVNQGLWTIKLLDAGGPEVKAVAPIFTVHELDNYDISFESVIPERTGNAPFLIR